MMCEQYMEILGRPLKSLNQVGAGSRRIHAACEQLKHQVQQESQWKQPEQESLLSVLYKRQTGSKFTTPQKSQITLRQLRLQVMMKMLVRMLMMMQLWDIQKLSG